MHASESGVLTDMTFSTTPNMDVRSTRAKTRTHEIAISRAVNAGVRDGGVRGEACSCVGHAGCTALTVRGAVFILSLLSLVAGRCRYAHADEAVDVDRLGIRARVALPVAVLSVDGAPDVPAGGLCLALGVRGFSRFTSRARGLVFEDGLDLSVTGSPFRGVSTGAGFTWRYGLELGVRGASTGVLLGTSVDTMGWAFSGNGGTGFTSAAVPTSLRLELRIARDARASGTAFATVLPFGARRYGGEVRIDLYAAAKDHYGGAGPGLAALGFYVQGSDTGGQAYLASGARKHASMALAEIGVIESFR